MSRPNPPSRWELGHFKASEAASALAFAAVVAAVLAAALEILLGAPYLAALPEGARRLILASAGAGVLCILYANGIEARRLTLRRIELRSPKAGPEPVRLLHLSDIHVSRWGTMEERIVALARELKPDLILMTGDYSSDRPVPEDVCRLVREIGESAPTYCTLGNAELRPPPYEKLIEAGPATWLLNETVERKVRGMRFRITGVNPGEEEAVRRLGPSDSEGSYSICLYHYPDLVPELEALPYDLMLCGHTHGGQIRLPGIGALVTLSRAGRKYARGLFQKGSRSAFVSQGIGCESFGLPRLRFLCPPEAVLITLRREG